MKKDGTIAMFRYWNMLRAGRPVPLRTEIDPTAIKTRLPDTFILEFDENKKIRFRLAGTNICALFARELRHLPFSHLWRNEDRNAITALAETTLLQNAVVFAQAEGRTGHGRFATFEILLLPLDGGPGMPRAIGIASPMAQPFWMGSHPVVDFELVSAHIVDPEAPLMLDVGDRTPSLSPDTIEPADGTSRRVRHLVVLDGGKSS